MNNLKTPLRYPGGKSRAAAQLVSAFPNEISEFREPFLGGGSVAIEFTKRFPDIPVWVNDKYYYLITFWQQLQCAGEQMAEELTVLKRVYNTEEKAKELFTNAKDMIPKLEPFQQAVYFYILNKCSFSGLTENSSFSKHGSVSNFSQRGIDKLPEYQKLIKNWKITNKDYRVPLLAVGSDADSEIDYWLPETPFPYSNCFVFLDPPYDIKDFLYGNKGGTLHKGFDHINFADNCKLSTNNWMITYNSNEKIQQLFNDFNQTEFDLTYTMRSTGTYNKDQEKRKELMITNYKRHSLDEFIQYD